MKARELEEWLDQPAETLIERYQKSISNFPNQLTVEQQATLYRSHQHLLRQLRAKGWEPEKEIIPQEFNTIADPDHRGQKRIMQEAFMKFYFKPVDRLPPELANQPIPFDTINALAESKALDEYMKVNKHQRRLKEWQLGE